MTRLTDIELAAANHTLRDATWVTSQCDRCALLGHAKAGETLPPRWRTDEYTGMVLCEACAEKRAAS